MKKVKLYSCVFTLLVSALACEAGESRSSVGIGLQYGGLVGWQGAQVSNRSISRLGVGVWGVTVGHDRFIADNLSFGVQIFGNLFLTGAGVNLNYYVGSREAGNLVIGIDVFRAQEPLDSLDGSSTKSFENNALISLGYMF